MDFRKDYRPPSDISVTPSGLTNGGIVTVVALNSATWTALPLTALVGRNGMGIQNDGSMDIKVNFATPAGYIGWTVYPSGEFFIDVTDSVTVYAKSSSGTPSVTVMEVG